MRIGVALASWFLVSVACSGPNGNSEEAVATPKAAVVDTWQARRRQRLIDLQADKLSEYYPQLGQAERRQIAAFTQAGRRQGEAESPFPDLAGVVETVSGDGQELSIRITSNPDAAPLLAAADAAFMILEGDVYKGDVEVVAAVGDERLRCRRTFVRAGQSFRRGDQATIEDY